MNSQLTVTETFITAHDYLRNQRPINLLGATVKLPGKGRVLAGTTNYENRVFLAVEHEDYEVPGALIEVNRDTQLTFEPAPEAEPMFVVNWNVDANGDASAEVFVHGSRDQYRLSMTVYYQRRNMTGNGRREARINWPACGSQPLPEAAAFVNAMNRALRIANDLQQYFNL